MMIAVLIDSRNPGLSGRVAVRHARTVQVRGLVSGLIHIYMHGNGHDDTTFTYKEDAEFELPKGVESVQAEIVKLCEKSRVSVDLE